MTSDAANMPFRRPALSDKTNASTASSGTLDTGLRLEAILIEEFNYAGVTAYQASEDRARMFNLYLLLVGVLGSGLGAVYQLGGDVRAYLPAVAVTLLVVTGILGFVFFVKLIRLAQAKRESLISMNKIKQFYIDEFRTEVPHIEGIFHWKLQSIPPGERFGSVSFLVCYTVAFLGSLCLGAAAFVAAKEWVTTAVQLGSRLVNEQVPLASACSIFLVTLSLQIAIYRRTLVNKRKAKADLEQDAREVLAAVQERR